MIVSDVRLHLCYLWGSTQLIDQFIECIRRETSAQRLNTVQKLRFLVEQSFHNFRIGHFSLVIYRQKSNQHLYRMNFCFWSSYSVARWWAHLSWQYVWRVDRSPYLFVREFRRRYAVDEETRLRSEGFRSCFRDRYYEYLPMDCYCSGLGVSWWHGAYSIGETTNNNRHRNHRNSRSYRKKPIVWSYGDVSIYAFYSFQPSVRPLVASDRRWTSTWLVPHRLGNVSPQNFESHLCEKNHPLPLSILFGSSSPLTWLWKQNHSILLILPTVLGFSLRPWIAIRWPRTRKNRARKCIASVQRGDPLLCRRAPPAEITPPLSPLCRQYISIWNIVDGWASNVLWHGYEPSSLYRQDRTLGEVFLWYRSTAIIDALRFNSTTKSSLLLTNCTDRS